MQQLTFEDLMADRGRSMEPESPPIPTNVTVAADDEKRLSGQSWDIYQALSRGAKFNIELVSLPTSDGRKRFIHNMTARISEIRQWLTPRGMDVLSYRLPKGVWLYRLGQCRANSRQIDINMTYSGSQIWWACPCCNSAQVKGIDLMGDYKSVQKSIEQNPLCHSCQARLEKT